MWTRSAKRTRGAKGTGVARGGSLRGRGRGRGRIRSAKKWPRQQRMIPALGPGNPPKDRDKVPDRGEMLAGRTTMQAPGTEERGEETPTEERAQVRAEERAEVGAEESAEEARKEAMEEAIKAVARGSLVQKKQWYGRLAARK